MTGRWMTPAWAAALGVSLFALQDKPPDPAAKAKDLEAAAKKAVEAFKKACGKGASAALKEEAIDKLKGADGALIAHDLVFAELNKICGDSVGISKKIMDMVMEIDHPRAADLLAAIIRKNMGETSIMEVMVKSMETIRWNPYYDAMAEFVSIKTFGSNKLTALTAPVIATAQRIGPMAMTKNLLKTLEKMDENLGFANKVGADSPESLAFRKNVIKAVMACSGMPEQKDAKEFEAYWKKNQATLEAKSTIVLWCPATGKRWEKKGSEKKVFCKYHDDPKAAEKEPQIVAYQSLQ